MKKRSKKAFKTVECPKITRIKINKKRKICLGFVNFQH